MKSRPYRVLLHRDFRRLWICQLVSLTGSQMQVVAINWHIYVLTHSPLALGLVCLTRVVPIIVFSLWGGIVADRRDRKGVMFGAQLGMALSALALAAVTLSGRTSVGLIFLLTAVSAAAGAFDNPARQALIPRLVPREDLPAALALNLTMFHASTIVGPALAGLLIAGGSLQGKGLSGPGLIYLLNGVSFAAVLFALSTMTVSGRVEAGNQGHETPVVSGGLATMVAIALIAARVPVLRRYEGHGGYDPAIVTSQKTRPE